MLSDLVQVRLGCNQHAGRLAVHEVFLPEENVAVAHQAISFYNGKQWGADFNRYKGKQLRVVKVGRRIEAVHRKVKDLFCNRGRHNSHPIKKLFFFFPPVYTM